MTNVKEKAELYRKGVIPNFSPAPIKKACEVHYHDGYTQGWQDAIDAAARVAEISGLNELLPGKLRALKSIREGE